MHWNLRLDFFMEDQKYYVGLTESQILDQEGVAQRITYGLQATSGPRRAIFSLKFVFFGLKSGPRDTYKGATWPSDDNSCPPLSQTNFMLSASFSQLLDTSVLDSLQLFTMIKTKNQQFQKLSLCISVFLYSTIVQINFDKCYIYSIVSVVSHIQRKIRLITRSRSFSLCSVLFHPFFSKFVFI